MSFILGIDTGGTYTDGVLVDFEKKEILKKNKAFTTKEDLKKGIERCLEGFSDSIVDEVNLVCLSTTLATNAIVEDRGCKVALIQIGKEPKGKLPADERVKIRGGVDIRGVLKENIDTEEVKQVIDFLKTKVDAFAISGYASVRNPVQEKAVKEIIQSRCEHPIVCAHELTGMLGYYERTVTAILNARLIPIVKELIESVKNVLRKRGINAPLMIVKGDGSLMDESFANERPIETIMSGPAASVVGGVFLAKSENALVVDIGGTTTDLAQLINGRVDVLEEGIEISEWKTHVKAIKIGTYGLGGDSHIRINKMGGAEIGPRKVWPLCVIGSKYPSLIEELKAYKNGQLEMNMVSETDCFMLYKTVDNSGFSEIDKKFLENLSDGPHSIYYLIDRMEQDILHVNIEKLIKIEAISRISFTPTDVLHVKGQYQRWNTEISKIAAGILARKAKLDSIEFVEEIYLTILDKIAGLCSIHLDIARNSHKKIVALGAPSLTWMGNIAEYIDGQVIIPEHAEVANAIGAAVGKVIRYTDALIRPATDGSGYIGYSKIEKKFFSNLEDAKLLLIDEIEESVRSVMTGSGCHKYEVHMKQEDIYIDDYSGGGKTYIETRIQATAIGYPFAG